MGSRLAIIFGALAFARVAGAQPGPLPAADLAKQGTELYAAGNYNDAAAMFQRALELEPNNIDYKFKLAQSYRAANRCDQALPIYKAITDTAPAENKSEIDAGIAQCSPKIAPQQEPPEPPQPLPPQPEPTTGGGKVSTGTALMLAGGGFALGAGVMLLWAGSTHSDDADAARSVSDYNRISGRATTEYVLGAIGIAAGVTLGALAFYRIHVANKESDTAVAFTPSQGGGTLVLERSW